MAAPVVTSENNNQPKTVKPSCYEESTFSMLIAMGNTVGSKFFFSTAEDYYIMGLWLADGYWRSSSIGLTSVNPTLIRKFSQFLSRVAPSSPTKMRVYEVNGKGKRKQTAFQVYINNRPLTRLFMTLKTGVLDVPSKYVSAYLAGRIDGDGHIDKKHRSGIRIAYANKEDALRDQVLFKKTNVSLYQYKTAGTLQRLLFRKY